MLIYSVLAISFCSGIAVQSSRILLPLYALHLDASPLVVGLIGATFAGLPLLLSVPVGKFADRFGSRWLMVYGAVAGAVGLIVPFIMPGITAIFFASALMGLMFGVFSVSQQNLVGMLSTSENRARYFSNHSLAASGGNLFGPLYAGYSIEQLGHASACLWLAGITAVLALALAIWGRGLPGGVSHDEKSRVEGASLLSDPGVRRVITASALLLAAQDLYIIYMPVYGHGLGMSPSTIGMVVAAFPAAAIFVRVILQQLVNRFSAERLLVSSFFVSAVSLALVPLIENAAALSVIGFAFGLGMGCSQPIITMLMYSNSPPGRSGEALGLRMTAVHFTRLVGPIAFGAIAAAAGLLAMFYVNALLMAAGGALSANGRRKHGTTGST